MTREEQWLGALAGLDGVSAPSMPVWHYEEMLAALYDAVVGADSPRAFPARSWKLDEFIYAVYCAVAGVTPVPACPEPTCRIELFWKGIYDSVVGGSTPSVPAPVWRLEESLKEVFDASAGWVEHTLGPASIVSFIGRSSSEITELTAAITPVQAGSGDPSPANERPITGYTGANIYRAKEQLYDEATVQKKKFINSSGVVATSSATDDVALNLTDYFDVEEGKSYTIEADVINSGKTATIAFCWFNGTTFMSRSTEVKTFNSSHYSSTATAPTGANKCRVNFVTNNFDTVVIAESDTLAKYTFDWSGSAGTVYGGTLDALTGELTVKYAIIDMGSVEYTMNTTHKFAAFFPTGTNAMIDFDSHVDVAPIMCSAYKVDTYTNVWTNINDGICVYRVGTGDEKFGVIDHNYSDKDSFKAAVTGQKVVYPLKTPKTYNLTAQQVVALVGQNYIWADTGDVTVTVSL